MSKKSKEGFHPLCMLWAEEALVVEEGSRQVLILKKIDRKLLFCAARPKRVQEFMNIERFMEVWVSHIDIFNSEPPEIALVYTNMPAAQDGIAYAIPIHLSNPTPAQNGSWEFDLSFPEKRLPKGIYKGISLFIDWLPSSICPEPVRRLFPDSVE